MMLPDDIGTRVPTIRSEVSAATFSVRESGELLMAPGLLGSDAQHILWWQMCIRAVFVFLFGLTVLRVFGRKAFGKQCSVNIVLAIVIGSNLSRTLTASAPFVPTLC
jgi:hypothetical protein